MRKHLVVVGAALYEFPNRKSVIDYLRVKVVAFQKPPSQVMIDPKAFGAKFVDRKPWEATDFDDVRSLLMMYESLDKENIDP